MANDPSSSEISHRQDRTDRDVADLRADLRTEVAKLETKHEADLKEARGEWRRDLQAAEERANNRTDATEKRVNERINGIERRGQLSRTQWVAIAGIIGTIVAAIIGAWFSSRGFR